MVLAGGSWNLVDETANVRVVKKDLFIGRINQVETISLSASSLGDQGAE